MSNTLIADSIENKDTYICTYYELLLLLSFVDFRIFLLCFGCY